ncbi:MAG: hypothetical protein ACKOPH_08485, partial [Methylocystis sp.]
MFNSENPSLFRQIADPAGAGVLGLIGENLAKSDPLPHDQAICRRSYNCKVKRIILIDLATGSENCRAKAWKERPHDQSWRS